MARGAAAVRVRYRLEPLWGPNSSVFVVADVGVVIPGPVACLQYERPVGACHAEACGRFSQCTRR
jgi:hypothetical protein